MSTPSASGKRSDPSAFMTYSVALHGEAFGALSARTARRVPSGDHAIPAPSSPPGTCPSDSAIKACSPPSTLTT